LPKDFLILTRCCAITTGMYWASLQLF